MHVSFVSWLLGFVFHLMTLHIGQNKHRLQRTTLYINNSFMMHLIPHLMYLPVLMVSRELRVSVVYRPSLCAAYLIGTNSYRWSNVIYETYGPFTALSGPSERNHYGN